jgi:hypothetical protein
VYIVHNYLENTLLCIAYIKPFKDCLDSYSISFIQLGAVNSSPIRLVTVQGEQLAAGNREGGI